MNGNILQLDFYSLEFVGNKNNCRIIVEYIYFRKKNIFLYFQLFDFNKGWIFVNILNERLRQEIAKTNFQSVLLIYQYL